MISTVSMAAKIAPLIIGIIFSLWHFPCFASERFTNSKLVSYVFGRYNFNFFLIIPDNLAEYEYLSHYPFTSFMFLNYYDEKKIAKLTVKELKSGSLGGPDSCCANDAFYEILKFEKLKGFEDVAAALIAYNEFDIAGKKDEILSKLIGIYGKYKADYNKYLQGHDGTYKFRKVDLRLSSLQKLDGYNETVEINVPNPSSFYRRIDIEDYDFDKQLFKIRLLFPTSKSSSQGWEYHYFEKFKEKYRGLEYQNQPLLSNIDFPEEMQIPMSLADAKKIFPDDDEVRFETIITVTPEKGAFGYQGTSFFVMTSNFNIKKVVKNYYRQKYWSNEENKFVGDPVFTIELESKENQPFY